PGAGSSGPSSWAGGSGTLVFSVLRPGIGYELWKSDGTETGTVFVKGFGWAAPVPLAVVDGVLFFQSGVALWTSDGSAAGTTLIRNGILPGPYGPAGCEGGFVAVHG